MKYKIGRLPAFARILKTLSLSTGDEVTLEHIHVDSETGAIHLRVTIGKTGVRARFICRDGAHPAKIERIA